MKLELFLVEVMVILALLVVAGILVLSGWASFQDAIATLEAIR